MLALDTETELITPRCKAPRLVCVSWASGSRVGLFKHDERSDAHGIEAARVVRLWLEDPQVRIVGQNIAYDMGVLAAQWPELLPIIFQAYADDRITDTMLRQKLIDMANGEMDHPKYRVGKGCYSLEALSLRHLGKQLDKDTWRMRYGELRDVPLDQWPEGAKAYPIDDAISTLDVWRAQEENAHYLADQYRQARHAFWLHLVACWGIATDVERVRELEESIESELDYVVNDLLAAKLLRPKSKKPGAELARDTKEAKRRMLEAACDVPCNLLMVEVFEDGTYAGPAPGNLKTTEKNKISLDDEACRASGDPLLVAYADYTHLAGMLNKDVAALKQGEIHPRFNTLLDTGRTSAGGNAQDGGYNVQNPARKGGVRECFIPRPGWLFVDSDYDGLELRTMSQACLELVGHSTMVDVLNDRTGNNDPHILLAARLLEPPTDYATCKARIKSGDPKAKEARQFAKIGNFGLAGGMGVATLVEYAKNNGIEITEEKAAEIRQAWLDTWPEFRAYFARAADLTADGEDAQAEQLFSKRFRGGLYFSQLCNTYFQGLGADAAKAAGWAISRACYDETQGSILFGCRIVNFVHDQFLVEVPDDDLAHDRAQEVGRLMVQEANKWLPDVPATTTPCLATCWSKDAEAVYDERGRLIPWSPQGAMFVGLFKWFNKLAAQGAEMRKAA